MVQTALGDLDRCDVATRDAAVAVLLQIALGVPHEVETQESHLAAIRDNAMLLFDEGVLETALANLFNLCLVDSPTPPPPPSLDANVQIRSWAAVVHSIIEVGRDAAATSADDAGAVLANRVSAELGDFEMQGTGVVELFLQVVHRFVDGGAHNIPIKKMLILCWKTTMLVLGDLGVIARTKLAKRSQAGLVEVAPPVVSDDGPVKIMIERPGAALDKLKSSEVNGSTGNGRLAGLVVVPEPVPSEDEMTETEATDTDGEADGEATDVGEDESEVVSGGGGGGGGDGPADAIAAVESTVSRNGASGTAGKKASVHKGTLRGKLGTMRNKKKVMRRKVTPKQFEALKASLEDRPPTQLVAIIPHIQHTPIVCGCRWGCR